MTQEAKGPILRKRRIVLLELTLGSGIRGILEGAFASRFLGLTRAVVHSGVGPFLGSARGFGLGLRIEELSVI